MHFQLSKLNYYDSDTIFFLMGPMSALRWKSLCFFCAKLQIRQPEVENAITLKRLKIET